MKKQSASLGSIERELFFAQSREVVSSFSGRLRQVYIHGTVVALLKRNALVGVAHALRIRESDLDRPFIHRLDEREICLAWSQRILPKSCARVVDDDRLDWLGAGIGQADLDDMGAAAGHRNHEDKSHGEAER